MVQAMKTVRRKVALKVNSDVETRTESLFGETYFVAPVVAMIEGVRFGANQSDPELGLATEFAQIPNLWSNRPVVLNHPFKDGSFVSANSADILEEYAFGLTMNPVVQDGKLKMEAWISLNRVEALGGEFQEILDSIQAGDTVEISVGFFSDLEPKKGSFKGQSYNGIWRNIRPDHLAILSNGTTGACSVKDGCGIPRINVERFEMFGRKPKVNKDKSELKTDSAADGGCGCGNHDKTACTCQDHEHEHESEDATLEVGEQPTEEVVAQRKIVRAFLRDQYAVMDAEQHKLAVQQIDSALTVGDIYKILEKSLAAKDSENWLITFTSDSVIYDKWVSGEGYVQFQQKININGTDVEFVGEPQKILLLSRIVPLKENDMVKVNSDPKVDDAKDQPKTDDSKTTETKDPTTVDPSDPAQPATTTNPSPTSQSAAPKAQSMDEYIANAPQEIREVLQSGVRIHQAQKDTAIKTLKESGRCKFSDDALKTMSLTDLENLVELLPPSQQGRAAPSPTVHHGGNDDDGFVPVKRYLGTKAA
jgi:hypothetical protein